MRIAVDAMGGDHAPARIVDGALAAARHLGIGVDLVGRAAAVHGELARHLDLDALDVRVIDAPDVVEMHEAPAQALRRKPRASIRVAAELVARGEAAALVSAGHTGAAVVAAHSAFGMLPGVDRPALAPSVPTRNGSAVLLDAGATLECKPGYLLQFGVMGSVYARAWMGIDRPRVGLLSIGEEETKGNDLTRDAHQLLKASSLHFIGNVEARDMFSGQADVIVCDGFTGNVALKLCEGLIEMVEELLGEELQSTFSAQMGYLLSRRAFRRFRKRVDYSEYGGAPLMGVAGLCIVCHGRSSAKAVRNAVAMASRFVSSNVLTRVEQEIASTAVPRTVIAFLFPGQGSQVVGMGRELAQQFPEARQVFDEADATLGESLSTIIFEGPADTLTLTQHTQPAILTASIAAYRVLASRGLEPAVVAGHSLGEYSAHVAAGTIAFADAVRIVRDRGRYMQEAVPVGTGAMAAILGLDAAAVDQACAEAAQGEVVSAANLNAPGQVVIAGAAAAVARAIDRAKALGAKRAIPLQVSAPFHCALMRPAEERLAPQLRALSVHTPRVPVVANVDAQPKTNGASAIEALIKQISAPVRWAHVMRRLLADGATTFVEVGPGVVLSGLGRKASREATFLNIESPEGLAAVEAAFRGAVLSRRQ